MHVELYGRKIDLGEHPSKMCQARWAGRYSPEPETVGWIETLSPTGVFYDIGASVGTHSIRAAVHGLSVVAFEPQSDLAEELQETVKRNDLPIVVLPLALSNTLGRGVLGAGRSTHTFYHKVGGTVTASTVDECVVAFGCPNYIKLDVDGNEFAILRGAAETLPLVRSLLVEIDPAIPGQDDIPSYLERFGFTYNPAQIKRDKITTGKYAGTANWIFYRP